MDITEGLEGDSSIESAGRGAYYWQEDRCNTRSGGALD